MPTNPPLTQREILSAMARIAGAPPPRVTTIPAWAVRVLGVFVPFMRELGEVRYQFERPFVIDSSAFETTFGIRPTPMEQALEATVAWWQERLRAAA